MKFHPITDLYPRMNNREFGALVEDIRARGLIHSIWLHPDGSVIDGRHRALACDQLGITPAAQTWNEAAHGELVAFVTSLNLKRRHLTVGQKAFIAARIANLPSGVHKGASSEAPSQTVDSSELDAATMVGVSRSSVQRARRVLRDGAPELIAAVERDEITISAAAEIAPSLPADEQRDVLRQGTAGRVAEDLRKKRIQPTQPKKKSRTSIRDRRDRMRTMAGEGHSSRQIAAALGLREESVRVILRQERIDCPGDRAVSHRKRLDASRILNHIVTTAEDLVADENLIDFNAIDRAQLPRWIEALIRAHKGLGSFIGRLKTLNGGRTHVEKATRAAHVKNSSGTARAH